MIVFLECILQLFSYENDSILGVIVIIDECDYLK